MSRLKNFENPNAPLVDSDIKLPFGVYFDASIREQGIKELNVEIFKRLVREQCPHKFA